MWSARWSNWTQAIRLAITIAGLGAVMCFVLFMSLMSNAHMRQFFGWYLAGGVIVYFVTLK